MILKQTFRNHLAALEFTFIINILSIIMGYLVFAFDPAFWISLTGFNALFTFPALYLHLEYVLANSGVEIEISSDRITIRKQGKEQSFDTSELSKITVYKSANMDSWGIPFTAVEYYYYARIETNLGTDIIITCLMTREVEKEVRRLRGVPYTRKKGAFCTLGWK